MQAIYYTVHEINGDYAILVNAAGEMIQIAMALLPEGIHDGDRIVREGFVYQRDERTV